MTLQALSFSGLNCHSPCSRLNGPSRNAISMRSGGEMWLQVEKDWVMPSRDTSIQPHSSLASSEISRELLHQGRKSLYRSTSATRSNIACAEYGTSADFSTLANQKIPTEFKKITTIPSGATYRMTNHQALNRC